MEKRKLILEQHRIGFLGGGAMAEALAGGLVQTDLVQPENIYISDVNQERLNYLASHYGVQTFSDNKALVRQADVILLAVKPPVLKPLFMEVGAQLTAEQMIISIVAGRSTAFLEQGLVNAVPVIRAMPNTPALVGSGATAVCCGSHAGERHMDVALALFSAVGRALPVQEEMMDAVTGLSGSGPAYMYLMVEALADAGVRAGLTRETARTLAAQTMLGAARMVLETNRHPGDLKDMVTTPAGTTIEGLLALEEGGVRAALGQAVQRAAERSKQLTGAASAFQPDETGGQKRGVTV